MSNHFVKQEFSIFEIITIIISGSLDIYVCLPESSFLSDLHDLEKRKSESDI